METINCPICNSASSGKVTYLKDRLNISNETFSLLKCNCGFVYLNPRPDENNIAKYYENINYNPHGKTNFIYKAMQKISFRWKLSVIKNLAKGNQPSILDYGAGKGEFASFIKKKNYNIDIYEPILKKIEFKNLPLFSNLKKIKKEYDMITCWHSLEHIHDLKETFNAIQNILKDKGYLLIAVPNLDAVEKDYFNENWAPYDAPRHLYHFNYKSMDNILNKYGFKIVAYKTIFQDTIYNIYLSSNSHSIFALIRVFYLSILSLLKILFINKKSSSSILYICKKQ